MPCFLLISCENGRQLKPYGVKRLEIYNMKFTFICIVTVISCSVCALGDLEIYPGLKYGPQVGRAILTDTEDDQAVYADPYRRWPWQKTDDYSDNDGDNVRKFQDFDFDLADILRRGKQGLSRNDNRDQRMRYYPKQRIRESFDQYRNLESDVNDYGQYHRVPNSQLLEDVRMYPQEDDFTFKDDDEDKTDEDDSKKFLYNEDTLDDKIVEANTRKYLKQMEKALNDVDSMMKHQMGETDNTESQDFSSGILNKVQFTDDPTEFAYAPPDPRFYVHPERTVSKGTQPVPKSISEEGSHETIGKVHTSVEDLKVKPRSDKHHEVLAENMGSTNVNLVEQMHNRQPDVVIRPSEESPRVYIIAIVAGISAAATVGLIAVGIGWYNLQKHVKNASDVEYPAYGVTGPNKDVSPSGDRRLAQSAQMYHYQHQKQQILAMENRATATDRHGSVSEADSEEENEEGDYTVYECPGLAPTGEMEVKNPMFQDDPTPAQTPPVKSNNAEEKK